MASRSVKLPDIGEGVAEAEIVEWHVKVGDPVREDQIVAAVMTDKATVEIPSPVDGTIAALGGETGQVLSVGSELFRLETGGEGGAAKSPEGGRPLHRPSDGPPLPQAGEEPKPQPAAKAPVDDAQTKSPADPPPLAGEGDHAKRGGGGAPPPPKAADARPAPPRPAQAGGPPRPAGEKPIASPAIRRRALEAGIDLRQVRGTGPAGRIGHDDLDAFLQSAAAPDGQAQTALRARNDAVEEIRVIGLRRRIAQKMADAKRRVAHFSYVEEVDVTALEELRQALNARYGASRPKLTLIPFLVAALVRCLPDFPQVNALYDDEAEIVRRFGGVHVGIATQTPNGLMVPVLRHAEARDLWDCAAEVKRLADAARTGLAARDELTGSTITITSLGALGGIVTTPVINRPEVAILGVNKQVMRPVWRENTFMPRLTMNLSSSFDHRVVDGYDAAVFVQALKGLLETPALLLADA